MIQASSVKLNRWSSGEWNENFLPPHQECKGWQAYFLKPIPLLIRVRWGSHADTHWLTEHHLSSFHFGTNALWKSTFLNCLPLYKLLLFPLVHTFNLFQFLFMADQHLKYRISDIWTIHYSNFVPWQWQPSWDKR